MCTLRAYRTLGLGEMRCLDCAVTSSRLQTNRSRFAFPLLYGWRQEMWKATHTHTHAIDMNYCECVRRMFNYCVIQLASHGRSNSFGLATLARSHIEDGISHTNPKHIIFCTYCNDCSLMCSHSLCRWCRPDYIHFLTQRSLALIFCVSESRMEHIKIHNNRNEMWKWSGQPSSTNSSANNSPAHGAPNVSAKTNHSLKNCRFRNTYSAFNFNNARAAIKVKEGKTVRFH